MKKTGSRTAHAAPARGQLAASTGSHCPRNGFWRPEEASSDPLFVFEGSLMPSYSGRSTFWFLVDTRSMPRD